MENTVNYKDIPDYIKTTSSVKAVNVRMKDWSIEMLLTEYMKAFNLGILDHSKNQNSKSESLINTELENICIYYMLKKELLKRMSPIIGMRSKNHIAKNNKSILKEFDDCLRSGLDNKFNKAQSLMTEIVKRIG
ncbi:MAG: hypothetical protein HFH60_10300 [Lachnospiraceae bacterium]|nr:hypothetical protein [Lachnospiraceae bacterium]